MGESGKSCGADSYREARLMFDDKAKAREASRAEREQSYGEKVLRGLPEKAPIYGFIRSVAPSGMSRVIDFYAVKDNELVWLTPAVSDLLGYRRVDVHGREGVRVHGAGMDMVFHTVYQLGSVLKGDGYYYRSEVK